MSRHAGLEPAVFAGCLTRRAQRSSAVLSNKAEGREGYCSCWKGTSQGDALFPSTRQPRGLCSLLGVKAPPGGREGGRETFLEIPPPCRRGCAALKDPRANASRAAGEQASSLAVLASGSKGSGRPTQPPTESCSLIPQFPDGTRMLQKQNIRGHICSATELSPTRWI